MLESEIREQIARYHCREISLAEFEHWFAPRAWGADREGDRAALDLVGQIELLLAEFSSRHRSEDEVRRRLQSIAENYTVRLNAVTGSTSTNSVSTSVVALRPFAGAGT
ncbi:MAG: hypothetical protein WEE64_04340 [Dehalococcoidia bacterium]